MGHDRDQEIRGWFAGRMPGGWFAGAPQVIGDRDEILVVGELAAVEMGDDATDGERAAASRSRVEAFREETREARMRIAEEAEHRFGRKVSWAVRIAGEQHNFTTLSVPVMTRLRLPERKVLDTLVDAGVARSRSEALAWCVRLVGDRQGEWIEQLREALSHVETVRGTGPRPGGTQPGGEGESTKPGASAA